MKSIRIGLTRSQDHGWEGRIVQLLNNARTDKETETDPSSPTHGASYSTHGSRSVLIHGDVSIHLHFGDRMQPGEVEGVMGRILEELRAKEGKDQ